GHLVSRTRGGHPPDQQSSKILTFADFPSESRVHRRCHWLSHAPLGIGELRARHQVHIAGLFQRLPHGLGHRGVKDGLSGLILEGGKEYRVVLVQNGSAKMTIRERSDRGSRK